MDADEILDKAFRRAVKIDAEGDSKFDMIQRKSAARIMATADIISTTLIKYNRAFPSLNDRNEFVAELINVLIGVDELKKALSKLEWAAQKVSELQREYTGKVHRATDLNTMDNERKQYYGRISSVLKRIDKDLKFLQNGPGGAPEGAGLRQFHARGGHRRFPQRRQEPAGGEDQHGQAADRRLPVHHPGHRRGSFREGMEKVPDHRYAGIAGPSLGGPQRDRAPGGSGA